MTPWWKPTSTTKTSKISATSKRTKTISTTTSPDGDPSARPRFALGLGANLGEPRRTLVAALESLEQRLGPLVVAPLYRTAPVSPLPQPDYFNTAVVGDLPAELAGHPQQILAFTQGLERAAGRDPSAPRWGPRPLDIDLLIWGSLQLDTPALTLPHPRLRVRRFVLAPLADIAPELLVPPDGARVAELLESLVDPHPVERVSWQD